MKNEAPARIWCLLRDQFAHVQPVEEFLGETASFVYDPEWDPERMVAASPDVVVCVNDVPYDIARCLDAAREAGIPSLVLQDGILEWRCQYENPIFGFGGGAPQHQPVLADKIACIGPSSAQHIASWGNAGKVELTGMPRLDYLTASPPPLRGKPGSRILVMTAKKPGFTATQVETTVHALRDLKNLLAASRGLSVLWRLTKDLPARLGVQNQLESPDSEELSELLAEVDAVVTTPSTAMLEAMLLDRPVACLDYHNSPRFVQTAWNISAPNHLSPVVSELLNPPESKMAFQRRCLSDALRCDGNAAGRVGELVTRMAAVAKEAREAGHKPSLPPCLVDWTPFETGRAHSSLRYLYPKQTVFQCDDSELLQVRLARAQKENESLKQRLAARNIGFWTDVLARKLAKSLQAEPRNFDG